MKRLLITALALLMLCAVAAAQNTNTKSRKPKVAKVDCSKVTDSQITDDVKARLAKAKSLKDLTINVATSGGTVTLTGMAKTGLQKGTATRVAKAASCVKKVDNQMTVEGAKPKNASSKPKNSNSKRKSNKNM